MVSPASIMLRLERLIRKNLLVEAILVGKPFEGFKITGKWVDPPAVEIVGAQNELKGLRKIFTEEVDVSGLKQDTIKKASLGLGGLHIKSVSSQEVKVNIKCGKVAAE